jgi:hypothetical protein
MTGEFRFDAYLEPCSGGAPQLWNPQSNGQIINNAWGSLCLESGTTVDSQVGAQACGYYPAEQTWTIPAQH